MKKSTLVWTPVTKGAVLMPKYVCDNCGHEFWGWGMYHKLRKEHDHVLCPDCDGGLIEDNDPPLNPAA